MTLYVEEKNSAKQPCKECLKSYWRWGQEHSRYRKQKGTDMKRCERLKKAGSLVVKEEVEADGEEEVIFCLTRSKRDRHNIKHKEEWIQVYLL